jgi:alanine racemase
MSETILEIHLPNLRHNHQFLKKRVNADTKILAVVKAFAYGSDAIAVTQCLAEQGVDYFGVAYVHEGIQLRKAGITQPILVLHPQIPNLSELIAHQLEPSIYSKRLLTAMSKATQQADVDAYPIHLKFNTGLNRLGFSTQETDAVLELLEANKKWIHPQGVYSHLAASDDLAERAFTQTQLDSFASIEQAFRIKYPNIIAHVLNTSGVIHHPSAQYDMVRTGISLYGYGNAPEVDKQLKPVLTLKTVISQIHHLKKGDSLGYNRAFVATQNTKTATLPIGHADGIGRIYGNGKGFVWIHGHKAPLVGNVCMDMIMVDVSQIDCEEGDEVLVIGPQASAENLANAAGTISYELITGLSQRIQRRVLN